MFFTSRETSNCSASLDISDIVLIKKKFVGRQKKNVVRQSADEINVNRLVEKSTTANVDKTFIRATCRADLLADKSLSVSSPLYHTAARHRRNPNRKALL